MDGDPYWIFTWELTAVFLTKGASHPAFLQQAPGGVWRMNRGSPKNRLEREVPFIHEVRGNMGLLQKNTV